MGAFVIEGVTLHDQETLDFVRAALHDDESGAKTMDPAAAYVGQMLAGHPAIREALDEGYLL